MAVIGREEFSNTVLVAGLGKSGKAAKEVLASHGVRCETFDEKADASFRNLSEVDWNGVSLVIASPAFPPKSEFIKAAEKRGIPIMSEVEFAWLSKPLNATRIPWVGVTGTNGKTTTVKMITKILQEGGVNVAEGGNTGFPLTLAERKNGIGAIVAELSSYQLHFTRSLALDVAVWTNFDQDHLNWHGSLEGYMSDKAKVFEGAKRAIIYNADDPAVSAAAEAARRKKECRKIGFTLKRPAPGQVGVEGGWIVDKAFSLGRILPISSLSNLAIEGKVPSHLVQDALAAAAAALSLGARPSDTSSALSKFSVEKHRLEIVAEVGKSGGRVVFIDDSKATNPASSLAALQALEGKRIIWIVGGEDKNCPLPPLSKKSGQIKKAFIIGKSRSSFVKALLGAGVPFEQIDEEEGGAAMDKAVKGAFSCAEGGDAVLLSPAAASHDQFKDMAERGEKFAEIARRIKGNEE